MKFELLILLFLFRTIDVLLASFTESKVGRVQSVVQICGVEIKQIKR